MGRLVERPGYFGRRRDEKVAAYDAKYGKGKWRLVWFDAAACDGLVKDAAGMAEHAQYVKDHSLEFLPACRYHYERAYYQYLRERPKDVDFICSYGECIDNAPTNVECGLDYSKQEAFSTHIQDIAIRNVLHLLGRKFEGPKDKILVIRSKDSDGFRFGPGNVPFHEPGTIHRPSLCPAWAGALSVEDFWQSNKWLEVDE